MTASQYEIGQWVRSRPVGTAPAFIGQIVERDGAAFIVRDDWRRRFLRQVQELETLQ